MWTVVARFFEDLVQNDRDSRFRLVPVGVRVAPFNYQQRMGGAAEGSQSFLRFKSPADNNASVYRWVRLWRDIAIAYIPTEHGLLGAVEGAREFFAEQILRAMHFVLENNPLDGDGFPYEFP